MYELRWINKQAVIVEYDIGTLMCMYDIYSGLRIIRHRTLNRGEYSLDAGERLKGIAGIAHNPELPRGTPIMSIDEFNERYDEEVSDGKCPFM